MSDQQLDWSAFGADCGRNDDLLVDQLIHIYHSLHTDGDVRSTESSIGSSLRSSDTESPHSSVGNSPVGSPAHYTSLYSLFGYNSLSLLEVERLNSKNEFNNNGKEVPLTGVAKVADHKFADYELFGKYGFNVEREDATARSSGGSSSSETGWSSPTSPTATSGLQLSTNDNIRPRVRRRLKTQMFCAFCKNNNETPEIYSGHILKDPDGKTLCPVLRRYSCPLCHNTDGDTAHTTRYCPLNRSGELMPSVIKQLKNSRMSDGKKRAVNY